MIEWIAGNAAHRIMSDQTMKVCIHKKASLNWTNRCNGCMDRLIGRWVVEWVGRWMDG